MHFEKLQARTYLQIPFFSFPISAGFPSPAEGILDKKIDLNEYIIKHPAATFFIKVSGDSMKDKGIYSGDLLAVDKSLEPKNGSIIVAVLNSEFTLKEFWKIKSKIILKPANKNYPNIEINEEDDFEVWGIVTNIIRCIL